MHITLVERGGVYGDFEFDNAVPVVDMRQAMGVPHHQESLPDGNMRPRMRCSTVVGHEYIRMKMARLRVTPEHEDTHLDIACYAILVLACIRRAKMKGN